MLNFNGLPDITMVQIRAIQMCCVYHCNQVFNKVQIGVAIVHLNVHFKKTDQRKGYAGSLLGLTGVI